MSTLAVSMRLKGGMCCSTLSGMRGKVVVALWVLRLRHERGTSYTWCAVCDWLPIIPVSDWFGLADIELWLRSLLSPIPAYKKDETQPGS